MKRKTIDWAVTVNGYLNVVSAKTAGHAANKTFQTLIKQKIIKHKPFATNDGGWQNTTIQPLSGYTKIWTKNSF